MSSTETRTISTAFSAGVEDGTFYDECVADATVPTPLTQSSDIPADKSYTTFSSALTGPQLTAYNLLVTAHGGSAPTAYIFHCSSKIVEKTFSITQDATWEEIGGVVIDVSIFVAPSSAVFEAIGRSKIVGTGAQLKITKGDTLSDISALFSVSTSGGWQDFVFKTNSDPDSGQQDYRLWGRLNGATSCDVKFVTMSLLESA